MTVNTWAAALTALPKAELRVHLEATMRMDTVRELARKNGVQPMSPPARRRGEPADVPGDDGHQGDGPGDLPELVRSVIRTRQDWALLAYESTLDAAVSGVVHREVTFSPARQLAAGATLADIVAGIDDGLTAGDKETGITSRVVYGIDRRVGAAGALELAQLLVEVRRSRPHGSERIVGVAMNGVGDDDLGAFVPVSKLVETWGLRRSAEVSAPHEIATALDELGCRRIDGGRGVLDDPALAATMVDAGIPVVVAPTMGSADVGATGLTAEVVVADELAPLRAAGVPVVLGAPEPALSGVSLAEVYRAASRSFGLDWDAMVTLARAAMEAAWTTDDERLRLVERIGRAAGSLRPAA